MIVIKFPSGTDWFKANWIFRQLAADVIASFPNDQALRLVMEKAQAFGGPFLDSMQAGAATSALEAIKKAAEETVQGKIQGWERTKPEDKDGQRMYRESIEELLNLIENEAGAA